MQYRQDMQSNTFLLKLSNFFLCQIYTLSMQGFDYNSQNRISLGPPYQISHLSMQKYMTTAYKIVTIWNFVHKFAPEKRTGFNEILSSAFVPVYRQLLCF